MRQAVIVGNVNGQWSRVTRNPLSVESLRMLIGDRRDNGDSFPAEQVVRLPRSVQINLWGNSALVRCKPHPYSL